MLRGCIEACWSIGKMKGWRLLEVVDYVPSDQGG